MAENTDGSTVRVSLGTVAAVDPEGAALSYSIEGGNGSGLFEIDAASGELFYTGAGEDFEAGTGPFELTVRAGDGDLSVDTAVSVSVTDVEEPSAPDLPDGTSTTGTVAVGGSVTGEIGHAGDADAYAVELVAGRTYRIDLEGAATSMGTLADPMLRWLRDETGSGLQGTRDDNSGEGANARQVFTPTDSGTYYISATAGGNETGTFTLTVTDVSSSGEPTAHDTQSQSNQQMSATDPGEGTTTPTSNSLVGGNEVALFELDAGAGELFYLGSSEGFDIW